MRLMYSNAINVQQCDQCTTMWSVYNYVISVQLCDQCTTMRSVYNYVISVQLCDQCTSMWSVYYYVITVQLCEKLNITKFDKLDIQNGCIQEENERTQNTILWELESRDRYCYAISSHYQKQQYNQTYSIKIPLPDNGLCNSAWCFIPSKPAIKSCWTEFPAERYPRLISKLNWR